MKLRTWRVDNSFTLADLAPAFRMSVDRLSRIETGKAWPTALETALIFTVTRDPKTKISNVTVDDLLSVWLAAHPEEMEEARAIAFSQSTTEIDATAG